MKLCQGNRVTWFNPETDRELKAEVLQVRVKKVQILTVDLDKRWVPIEETQLEALPCKTKRDSITPSNLDSERDLPVIEDSITEVLVSGDRIKEDSITEVLSDRIRFMGDRVRVKNNGALGTVKFFGNRLVTVHFDGEIDPRGVDRKFLEKIEIVDVNAVIETSVIENSVIEDSVIEDAVIESYPVTLGTYQKGKNTYHRISYRDGSRVKHHHVTSKLVDTIRNAIASKLPRVEILEILKSN